MRTKFGRRSPATEAGGGTTRSPIKREDASNRFIMDLLMNSRSCRYAAPGMMKIGSNWCLMMAEAAAGSQAEPHWSLEPVEQSGPDADTYPELLPPKIGRAHV